MQSTAETNTDDVAEPPALARHWVVRPVLWYLASVVAVLGMSAARIVREPRFFFWDDTQLGSFGQWYGLGSRILAGDVTILSPGNWQGGNYLAEGQWGIWNPVTWLIALGTHLGLGATTFSTVIKIAFLILLCTGVYLLARAYGAAPWWAAVAGFAASAGGQTIYLDAPSWVTGLQNVALFCLAWWALKRHIDDRKSPIPFFVFAYLLITFGYVFGVIELALLLIAALVSTLLDRRTASVLRVLLLGVYSALLTVFVFLPGILTSPVTIRSGSSIENDQFLGVDLGDLATSPISTAVGSVRGYWGDLLPVPLQYVSWVLPFFAIFAAATWRRSLKDLLLPITMLGLSLAIVLGPSVVGPLRYPARMMPYVVVAVVVIFAVVASRGWPERVTRSRAVVVVALTVAAGWVAWAAQPSSWTWILIAVVIQIGAVVIVLNPFAWRQRWGTGGMRAAALILCGSLVVLLPQVVRYPSAPVSNFNVPSSTQAMHAVADDMGEGIMTVGDVYSLQRNPASYEESLLANLWYTTEKDTASVYTVLPFTSFAHELCADIRGATCPEALDALFDESPVPLADDMMLNTIVVVKGPGLLTRPHVPSGWSVANREFTWLLTRDVELQPAGGVARTTSGVSVTELERDELGVTVRVDEVDDKGQVVFSRLAWPGYVSDEAALGEPARDFLLTLDVSSEDEGRTVRVEFRPPGWTIEVTSAIVAVAIAILWSVAWGVIVRARQRGSMWAARWDR